MADPRFFKKSRTLTLAEILNITDTTTSEETDSRSIFSDVCDLERASLSDVSFFDNVKYKGAFQNTKAGACFVNDEMAQYAPDHVVCLLSPNPYKAYALCAQAFYPDAKPSGSIHSTAFIDETATVGAGSYIGANVSIGADVMIGENAWIEANAVISDNVEIGNNVRVGANATLSHAVIGDYVRFYPGVRIGQDGFGFAIDPAGHVKVPQLGRVIVEDHVEIGANTTIDRGAGPDTVIGQGSWIDNLVQIGHNVQIGKGCVIVAQVGVSGSTVLEDYVVLAGQAGVAGHLTIGSGARIGAQAGVISDIPRGQADYMGSPAMPRMQFFRQIASLNRLIMKKKND